MKWLCLTTSLFTVSFNVLGRVVQSRVSVKFEFGHESLKSKFSFILSANNLMIGCSKKSRENYPAKCF